MGETRVVFQFIKKGRRPLIKNKIKIFKKGNKDTFPLRPEVLINISKWILATH